MTYFEYMKGKTVALIGCAGSLEGSKQLAKIESHDVVARINRGFPVQASIVADTGSRTDVLYHLLNVHIAGSESEFKPCLGGALKWIISVHPIGTPRVESFRRLNRGRVPFESVPTALRQAVHAHVRKAPNAGVVALAHLLTMETKAIYLTGFSFYEDGYYAGYNDKAGRNVGGQAGHDQVSAKRYVRHLVQTNPRIEVDDVLKRILFDGGDPVRQEAQRVLAEPGKVLMMALTPLRIQAGMMVLRGEQFFADAKQATAYTRTRKAMLV